MQDSNNSNALAMEFLQFSTNPSMSKFGNWLFNPLWFWTLPKYNFELYFVGQIHHMYKQLNVSKFLFCLWSSAITQPAPLTAKSAMPYGVIRLQCVTSLKPGEADVVQVEAWALIQYKDAILPA